MELIWEKSKELLRKLTPLYEWYIKRRSRKSCERLQKNGYDISTRINEILEKSNISYFFTYGTLLGLIRDNGFIKHDNDLDIGILKTDDFSWDELSSLLSKSGLAKLHEFGIDGKVTEQTYTYKGTGIDFFLYEYEGDKMISYVYFKKEDFEYKNDYERSVSKMISSQITDFKYVVNNGVRFRIPENAEEYLQDIYSETWRIPNPNWVSENGPAWNELKGMYGTYMPKNNE